MIISPPGQPENMLCAQHGHVVERRQNVLSCVRCGGAFDLNHRFATAGAVGHCAAPGCDYEGAVTADRFLKTWCPEHRPLAADLPISEWTEDERRWCADLEAYRARLENAHYNRLDLEIARLRQSRYDSDLRAHAECHTLRQQRQILTRALVAALAERRPYAAFAGLLREVKTTAARDLYRRLAASIAHASGDYPESGDRKIPHLKPADIADALRRAARKPKKANGKKKA